jgi:hypothetical protein
MASIRFCKMERWPANDLVLMAAQPQVSRHRQIDETWLQRG